MVTKVGTINSLEVLKEVSFGIFLDAGDLGEILMPKRYVPEGTSVGDRIDAFIHHDSEDRLIATTETPKVMVGQCAFLKVQATVPFGAFVNWGLPKDLLVPTNQQAVKMEEGYSYVVHAYLDGKTGRIAGSSKLSLFLKEDGSGFRVGEQVDLLIAARSDLGFKAVINDTHLGLIFHEEVKEPLKFGARMKGYIKQVRKDDNRIDLALDAGRATTRKDLNQLILDNLKKNGGVSNLSDKADADLINQTFGVSKGNYKKALGALYKQKLITIAPGEIRLIETRPSRSSSCPTEKDGKSVPTASKKTSKSSVKKKVPTRKSAATRVVPEAVDSKVRKAKKKRATAASPARKQNG